MPNFAKPTMDHAQSSISVLTPKDLSETVEVSHTSDPLVIGGCELTDIARRGIVLSGLGLKAVRLDDIASHIDPLLLRQISLASNALTQLDLAPLSICSRLESLMLNGNRLSSIDLTPLRSCVLLEKLWLHDNTLTSIDLEPLSACLSLKSLYLDRNDLKTQGDISLAPLTKCKLLRSVRLGGNPLSGPLDVSGVLNCVSLSILDVPSRTQLVALVQNAPGVASGAPLPPALRKHSVNLKWLHSSPTPVLAEQPKPAPLTALLVGFTKKAIIATENLFKSSSLTCVSVPTGQPFDSLVARDELKKFHVCLLTPVAVSQIVALQQRDPWLPLVVVGNDSSCADAVSRCLRRGADCFFTEPLGNRALVRIRQLAEKRAKDTKERSANSEVGSKPPHLSRSRSCPATLLLSADRKLSFEKIRARHLRKNIKGAPIARSRFEENSLAVAFTRAGGIVSDNEFATIASLCGLPTCLSALLFMAASRDSGAKLLRKEVGVSGLDYDAFSEFYAENLRDADIDTRIFAILKKGRDATIHPKVLESVVESFITHDKLPSLPGEQFECEKQRRGLVSTAAAMLAFGISGRSGSISLFDLRQSKLGSALISAETGVFDGVMQYLQPEHLVTVVNLYAEATDSSSTLALLRREDFIRHCRMKGTLMAGAAGRLVDRIGLQGCIDMSDYGRFQCAISNSASWTSIKYLFSLADDDADGVLGVEDLAQLYMEKRAVMASNRVTIIGFPVVCRWVSEMLQLQSGTDSPSCTVRPKHLKNLRAADLDGLWKALLFIEDELALADLRQCAHSPSTGFVPTSSTW